MSMSFKHKTADAALKRWGVWSSRREDSGLGYPKRCSACKLEENGGQRSPVVLADSVVLKVDKVLAQLRVANRNLYAAAVLWYVHDVPASVIAVKTQTCIKTVYNRIDAVIEIVSNNLSS